MTMSPSAWTAERTEKDSGVFDEDGEHQTSSSRKCHNNVRIFRSMLAISIIFTVIFAYAAIVQYNDSDSVYLYATFYLFHFTFSFLVFLHQILGCRMCTRHVSGLTYTELAFLGVAGAMVIWSVVMVIIPATKFPVEGEMNGSDMVGDNKNATLEEELLLEIFGACVGLFSIIYHVMWLQVRERSWT